MSQQFPLKSDTAQKVWEHFDTELKHKLRPLPLWDREDIRLEILSHLYESAQHVEGESEADKIVNAIHRMGSPDEYLTPLISEILQAQEVSKGHPHAILNALIQQTKKGLIHFLATLAFGFGYFISILIFIMGLLHIVDNDVGVWLYPDGGFMSLSFTFQNDAVQWMPNWFSLIAISASVVVYLLLNKLLFCLLASTKKSISE
ncbi:MAG: hypothetical protein KJ930_07055 [Gammaproteobacteria bacterium]|jgi:uncharacterized membrane protein|nr:hypothetical protein [Gammaproteobacteria bacterium]MBU2179180.1 hypothetical protein [Gammaproteobacteria bacterium]MBU2224585.1 hypothetical protein [Gammaproteobacteria bacterium]MBU2278495.1 hypothetical protein [Gammaproteobacteria bacterium]MBU2427169.1 hypothetical protein [Gammaproteobacteria bacterium]